MKADPFVRAEPGDPDDLESVLREARQRFMSGFHARCDSIGVLLGSVAANGPAGPLSSLREIVHRTAGLAGTVGFPCVSEGASALESVLAENETPNVATAQAILDRLRREFSRDLETPPLWADIDPSAVSAEKVLLVEDDDEQRMVVAGALAAAGCRPIAIASGEIALAMVRAEHPALVLLDVELPGLDGYAICRLIKADPDLATIPVVFMTTKAKIDDRLAGLTLGADDYLTKPVDIRELILRIQRLMLPRQSSKPLDRASAQMSTVLTYEAFACAGREMLGRSATTLVLVRAPAEHADLVITAILSDIRRRDLIARFDSSHFVIMLPEMPAASAARRLGDLLTALGSRGIVGVHAGVAASAAAGALSLAALLAQADEALAEARYLGQVVAIKSDKPRGTPCSMRTAVLAEDDPEVVRIVDARMRSAGYRTVIAFDGQQALDAIRGGGSDVLVLDLMMPKLTGFDVLAGLREVADVRPKVIVLSGRGREDDIVRAFDLGADDYLTKPFSPEELLARVTRLLR